MLLLNCFRQKLTYQRWKTTTGGGGLYWSTTVIRVTCDCEEVLKQPAITTSYSLLINCPYYTFTQIWNPRRTREMVKNSSQSQSESCKLRQFHAGWTSCQTNWRSCRKIEGQDCFWALLMILGRITGERLWTIFRWHFVPSICDLLFHMWSYQPNICDLTNKTLSDYFHLCGQYEKRRKE